MTNKEYDIFKQQKISGRHITLQDIEPILLNLSKDCNVKKIGESYLKKSIYKIKIGTGKKKILIWSQMHGNESTGTKAVFDFINFMKYSKNKEVFRSEILEQCTILIIPILNPDGAQNYTRVNAQEIDLNRDAVDLKAPESKLLHKELHKFKPDFCFNLHDQRAIFSVGKENKPATISFLAPSIDKKRSLTAKRKETMRVIVAMNKVLQRYIPNQIGRYTDEFYPTATGDNFQKAGFNTILIESGHYKGDFEREKVRMVTFIALLNGIKEIYSPQEMDYKAYFDIPNNKKQYLNKIFTNLKINNKKRLLGVYYSELLINNKIKFKPVLKYIRNTELYGFDDINDNLLIFKSKENFVNFLKL